MDSRYFDALRGDFERVMGGGLIAERSEAFPAESVAEFLAGDLPLVGVVGEEDVVAVLLLTTGVLADGVGLLSSSSMMIPLSLGFILLRLSLNCVLFATISFSNILINSSFLDVTSGRVVMPAEARIDRSWGLVQA